MAAAPPDASLHVCEVWAGNLYEEMERIRQTSQIYTYIAMDTKFPGLVNRPANGAFPFMEDQYQVMRLNVEIMQILKLTITFMNADGEFPPGTRTWQFNFKFNLIDDEYSQDSIDQLRNSGVQLERHQQEGIEMLYFIEVFRMGCPHGTLPVLQKIKWITFHSGHDFAYLLRLLRGRPLPGNPFDFFLILDLFFPRIYDVKCLMEPFRHLNGDLQDLAVQLRLPEIGQQHQAGSESALIGMAFFRMKELYFKGKIDVFEYSGKLYELEAENPPATLRRLQLGNRGEQLRNLMASLSNIFYP